jgi:hypothetical protein
MGKDPAVVDHWKRAMAQRTPSLVQRSFRPARDAKIEALAAMTDVSIEWLRSECERTSFEGMLVTLGVVQDRENGATYWERMCARETLPMAWLDDPSRLFFARNKRKTVELPRELDPIVAPYIWQREFASTPLRALDALSIATDAAVIVEVEALAREAAMRISPWVSPLDFTVHWSVLRHGGATEGVRAPTDAELPASVAMGVRVAASRLDERWHSMLDERVRWTHADLRPLTQNPNTRARPSVWYFDLAVSQCARDSAWRVLAGTDAMIDDERAYASALNPFEPMVAIIERGYLLEAIRADGLWLYAPSM